MNAEELQALIAGGETLAVEFKGEERDALNDHDLVEAVVCMANRPTLEELGYVLVGVEDDGRVTGARPRHESGITDVRRVEALIAARTQPALTSRAELAHVRGHEVLVVTVYAARTPVGTADGRYLRRSLGGRGQPECRPFHFHEMQAMQADRGMLDYSALIMADALWEDLDPLEFERFRRTIRENRGAGDATLLELPDRELAKALGAVVANHEVSQVRVLGLLLFGTEDALRRLLPTHEVGLQVMRGVEVAVNQFYRWPLLRVVDETLSRFRALNQETEYSAGMLRIGIPDYSERGFREAVANAMLHRDYARLGTVLIQWHGDRLEISNPGGFPEGVRLDNLLVTPPRPRNPLLADAFKRAGIVERTGRGIDIIYYEQLRNGRPAPSYERSTETGVMLVLPGGRANLDFVRLMNEEAREGRLLTLDELLILNQLWLERNLNTPEASRLIQKPESDARAALQHLVEAGLVEARGERKGRTYQFSAETYDRMGLKSAYVRQRGFAPRQREQMILQWVDQYGSISRSEAVTLCKIGGGQASRLLHRLVQEGLLQPTARAGRAVRYCRK